MNGAWARSSDLVRTPTYTLKDGLMVLVGAGSNGDRDHNDLVIQCPSLGPKFTPWRPVTKPRTSRQHHSSRVTTPPWPQARRSHNSPASAGR
jgi:hypothetical protein